MTWRQFTTWTAWTELEWNRPSRSDYYTMQVGATIEAVNSKKRSRIDLNKRKIKFKSGTSQQPRGLTREQIMELHKKSAIARACGGKMNLVRYTNESKK